MSDASDFVFITVGTTPFNEIFFTLSETSKKYRIITQTAGFQPSFPGEHHSFLPRDSLIQKLERARVAVTHAGAGSVYSALEAGANLIIVPNLLRADKHQQDIARYMECEGYARVVWDLKELPAKIEESWNAPIRKIYRKDPLVMPNWLKTKILKTLNSVGP